MLDKGLGLCKHIMKNFRAVLSQAGISPIIGAEALCGISSKDSLERIRTAIAGCSDVDLDILAVQAKRVDADLSLHFTSTARVVHLT
jgi:hypothetical protein